MKNNSIMLHVTQNITSTNKISNHIACTCNFYLHYCTKLSVAIQGRIKTKRSSSFIHQQ